MQEVITDTTALRNIAANVRHFRGARTLVWLAEKADTYPTNIKRIEDAEDMPGAGLIARIAEALEVSVDQLLAAPPRKTAVAS